MVDANSNHYCDLCGLCQSIALAESREALFGAIVQGGKKILRARACVVRVLDERRQMLEHGAAVGVSEEYTRAVVVERSRTDAQAIQGRMIEIGDIEREGEGEDLKRALGEGARSALVVPLCVRDRCMGVLYLYFDAPRTFSDHEKLIARTLSVQAGMVLQRLQLQREAEALGEIAREINSSLEEDTVLHSITRQAAVVLGFKGASLRMLDDEGRRLEEKATYGISESYVRKGPVELDKSAVDREVLEGRTVVVMEGEFDRMIQYADAARQEGIGSILCVPLKIKRKTLGVLRVYSSTPYRFNDSDIKFLETLANQGALAMENARLFEHLRRDYQDLTQAVWKWYDWGERPPKM